MAKRRMRISAGRNASKRPAGPKHGHPYRRPRVEALEPRLVLAAPTLAGLDSDVVLLAGSPLHFALDGFDTDEGDILSYTVDVSSATPGLSLETLVPDGNQSLRMSVADHGDMVLELFEGRAPETTARIIELVEAGFYDGLTFHRIIKDFMIQGGDPLGNGTGGSGVTFDDEFNDELLHTSAGVLSMANSGPDSNDSQFFITDGPTRHLDGKHSVFGFLTEGESVRQSIENVTTYHDSDGNNLGWPLIPVVIDSIEVFDDIENGVLMLSAPVGSSGEADVTVTVNDGNGGTDSKTFHVTVLDPPQWTAIEPVVTSADTPVTVDVPYVGVSGEVTYFQGTEAPQNDDLDVNTSLYSGTTIVTPSNGLVGVEGMYVTASAMDGYLWYEQHVPVYVHPGAPQIVQLAAGSDTGASDSDGVTKWNNTASNALQFVVDDVLPGSRVTLFADGIVEPIGEALATGTTVTITTNGTVPLADGTHSITAVQTLVDQVVDIGDYQDVIDLASDPSTALTITVDATAPAFLAPPPAVATEHSQYAYDVQTDDDPGGVSYLLLAGPDGMTVDGQTGEVVWTPGEDQGGQSFVVNIWATNTAGLSAVLGYAIEVEETNDPPVVTEIPQQFIVPGETFELTVEAVDPDVPDVKLDFSLEAGAPAGAIIDDDTGQITWAVSEDQPYGRVDIPVRITELAEPGLPAASVVVVVEVRVVQFRTTTLQAIFAAIEASDFVAPTENALPTGLPIATQPIDAALADEPAPGKKTSLDDSEGSLHWAYLFDQFASGTFDLENLFGTTIGFSGGSVAAETTTPEGPSAEDAPSGQSGAARTTGQQAGADHAAPSDTRVADAALTMMLEEAAIAEEEAA